MENRANEWLRNRNRTPCRHTVWDWGRVMSLAPAGWVGVGESDGRWFSLLCFVVLSVIGIAPCGIAATQPLTVSAGFEGASVANVEIDQTARSIGFMPGGDPARGWPCWWYFRVDGVTPGETLTLRLRGSPATVATPGAALYRPLDPKWAMPARATCSSDGRTWGHTGRGARDGEWMVYTVPSTGASLHVAWGPPYTPSQAMAFLREISRPLPWAEVATLCHSREGRAVPVLRVSEGERSRRQRFGVWVQARQHAWESGSTWVAHGFVEWLLGGEEDARWLRRHAEIFVVPIMDIDNTARGHGGKDAQPHDHNRDWSDRPHWNETAAAQRRIQTLIEEGRMDVFLDLHNPAPGEPTFFFALHSDHVAAPAIALRNRFIDLSYLHISRATPVIPMSRDPRFIGAANNARWRTFSNHWVSLNGNPQTVSLCLETAWDGPSGTSEGYRAVGSNLAAAVCEYLGERLRSASDPFPKP
jgi:hypothetical protein